MQNQDEMLLKECTSVLLGRNAFQDTFISINKRDMNFSREMGRKP